MEKPKFFVGIDISSENFTATVGIEPWQVYLDTDEFANNMEGFTLFHAWLKDHEIQADQVVVCMEATGVYGEKLAYFLTSQSYLLAVEPPLKVKRAFAPYGHKNDRVDSQQIAEYSLRFYDELHFWQPKTEIVEQIQTLLSTREQLVKHKTAHLNQKHALARKVVWSPLAITVTDESIEQIEKQIKQIEREIQNLVDQDPKYGHMVRLLKSIPGVGLLMAANIILIIESIPDEPLDYKKLAAFIGICPYEKRSGSSVYRPASSRHFGPARTRKLLNLAARSLKTHHPAFNKYYIRKMVEGKDTRIILNNIANKLLKIMCAVLRNNTPYIEAHCSVHPSLLKNA
jgi:transposase